MDCVATFLRINFTCTPPLVPRGGNETAVFDLVLLNLARRLAGLTDKRQGHGTRGGTTPNQIVSTTSGFEKESPTACLQKLHLTERGNSIQNAVLLIFTEDEFSMV